MKAMRTLHHSSFDRRSLLQSALAWGGLGMATELGGLEALLDEEQERSLVLIQLSGGNDGLSTIVPHGDDAYQSARPKLGLRTKEVLDVDGYRGFSPQLPALHKRFMDGGLALVEGVGYPNPNRSHFKSYEIWHAADLRGRTAADGWVGRLIQSRYGNDVQANRVVHMGGTPPYSLHSQTHPAAAFSSPAGYRWVKGEAAEVTPPESNKNESEALKFLRKSMRSAHDSSLSLRAAVTRYRTPVVYPRGSFGDALRNAAAMIEARVGARVLSIELDGFDTHNDQARRHQALMQQLDEGLAAFLPDLERSSAGSKALVLVFSEFGRRVAENASGGTDHGCAGPMFVAGSEVKPGLYGKHPSLTKLDEGDLIFNIDFRSVYACAIESCFGVPSKVVLGKSFKPLALLG